MSGILNWVKSNDKFSDPVQVKYNGAGGFKTVTGGFLSLISKIVVTIFMIFNAERLFLNQKPSINITEEHGRYELDTKQF